MLAGVGVIARLLVVVEPGHVDARESLALDQRGLTERDTSNGRHRFELE
jgi:hypothetical protein